MANSRICSVANCGKRHFSKNYCRSHYDRWTRHGDPLAGKAANGELRKWLEANSSFSGDECLIWPHGRGRSGYGLVTIAGQGILAHRYMCELEHGPAPNPKLDAAHSCGNGHLGCVNPKHLRWATRSENVEDAIEHGTFPIGEAAPAAKLTEIEVRAIRSLQGVHLQETIAQKFGVSRRTISDIHRRMTWRRLAD